MVLLRISLCVMTALSAFGCGDPPATVSAPVAELEIEVIAVEAIKPGTRPQAIKDARFVDPHTIHQRTVPDEEWICLEGVVKKSGTIMGAYYLNLVCNTCKEAIHCEGYELGKYSFPPNVNIVVRGRYHNGILGISDLVFQNQIDSELSMESNSNEVDTAPDTILD